jgi:hypothetical protein
VRDLHERKDIQLHAKVQPICVEGKNRNHTSVKII